MMKPPISRLGGKSKLRKKIIEMLPEHKCYVELFFGAGWVYFGKEPSKVEVINDIEKEITNLFKMLKYHHPEIEREMEFKFSGRDLFEEYKNCNLDHLTEIHRAVRFMYLLNNSFAAKGGHYGYGTTQPPKKNLYDLSWIREVKDRLKNTYVENLSYEKIIDKYDKEGTIFFADPPYYNTVGYENPFTEEDHIKLNKKLKSIKGKFLLTINDHARIRELYKDFNIREVDVSYSVSRDKEARKRYGELIITNY